GGYFTRAGGPGGIVAANLARWDGAAWSAIPGGDCDDAVHALRVHDDGSGLALYAGGGFDYAGGVPVRNVARWNGTAWAALGGGLLGGNVYALAEFDDGRGPALYAGGSFYDFGAPPLRRLARWDGASWSPVGGGVDASIGALAVFSPPGGRPGLYVGSETLQVAGGVGCAHIARWDGQEFSALGDGRGLGEQSRAGRWFDDGSGPALIVAGSFRSAGTLPAPYMARWTDTGWGTLPEALGATNRLRVLDDGSGPALYAGGAWGVATWNGTVWTPLGDWFEGGVYDFCRYDDGHGPALYVVGGSYYIGGTWIDRIAKWDGVSWSGVYYGLCCGFARGVAVFDDGRGPALYVCGEFRTAAGGTVQVNGIARWDGRVWSGVGGGLPVSSMPHALLVHDDGTGQALYMAGTFSSVGGIPANNIARWRSAQWEALGAGVNRSAFALAEYDDGAGPALYAGGDFTAAGGRPVSHVARWRDGGWSALGDGIYGGVHDFASGIASGHSALFALGGIYAAGQATSAHFAVWRCVEGARAGDLNCDGEVDFRDVNPFVLALTDRGAYLQRYPECIWLNADVSGDGLVDFNDINPLVELLVR
ncbi:MAG: hypothetical protein AB1716_22345, partial [Planctomycetota bacterium]